jgi:hypothetical protein
MFQCIGQKESSQPPAAFVAANGMYYLNVLVNVVTASLPLWREAIVSGALTANFYPFRELRKAM